ALMTVSDDIGEVLAERRLAAGDDEGWMIQLDELIDDEAFGLIGGQFAVLFLAGVGVAMRTGEIADAGTDPLHGLGRWNVAEAMHEARFGLPDLTRLATEQTMQKAHVRPPFGYPLCRLYPKDEGCMCNNL